MDYLYELRKLAEALQQDGPYWRSFNRTEHLMGWLYAGGKCAYCDVDLVETGLTITGEASTDHLLPKSRYPGLDADPLNAVPACAACNHTKGRWDPNEGGETPAAPLTPEMRLCFIGRARDHIKAIRSERAGAFRQDLDAWRKSLASRPNSGGFPLAG